MPALPNTKFQSFGAITTDMGSRKLRTLDRGARGTSLRSPDRCKLRRRGEKPCIRAGRHQSSRVLLLNKFV